MKYKIFFSTTLLFICTLLSDYFGYPKIYYILRHLMPILILINFIFFAGFVTKENKRIFSNYFSKKKKTSVENESDPKSKSDLNAEKKDSQ
jgi:hypothetical protein